MPGRVGGRVGSTARRAASGAEDGLALLDAEELGHQRACLVWKELLVEPVEQEAQELLRVLLPPRGEEVAVRPHGLHEGVRRGRAPAALRLGLGLGLGLDISSASSEESSEMERVCPNPNPKPYPYS